MPEQGGSNWNFKNIVSRKKTLKNQNNPILHLGPKGEVMDGKNLFHGKNDLEESPVDFPKVEKIKTKQKYMEWIAEDV